MDWETAKPRLLAETDFLDLELLKKSSGSVYFAGNTQSIIGYFDVGNRLFTLETELKMSEK